MEHVMSSAGGGMRFLACAAALWVSIGLVSDAAGAPAAKSGVRPVRKDLQIEDLGSPVQRRKIGLSLVYRAPQTGHLHLFLTLTGANQLENDPPYQILDFNLQNGKVRTAMGCEGSGGSRPWLHSNGKLYLPQARPPELVEYDPETGKTRDVGRLTPNYYHATQSVDEGPNGALYFGLYGRHACRYDPKTDKIEDFGPMGGKGNHYIYDIASDGRYVYCGMAEKGKWYLIVYDMEAKKETVYRDLKGRLTRATDGNIYFAGRLLKDGKPVKLEKRPKIQRLRQKNLWRLNEIEKELGLELDLTDVNPHTWNNGSVSLRWRPKGAEEWASATFKGVSLVPNPPKVMAPTPEGRIMGFGSWYGPIFLMEPDTGKTEYLGPAPCSVADMLVLKDRAYFCGYSSVLAAYDRTQPYTLSIKNAYYSKEQNPYRMPAAKWTTYLAEGADGRIYAAGNNARHSFGGVFLVFEPGTAQHRYIWQQNADYRVSDLQAMHGGQWMVLSTCERAGDRRPTVFVYDTAKQDFIRQFVLTLDVNDADGTFPTGPDSFVGVVRMSRKDDKDPEQTIHEFLVYKVDITNEKVLFQQKHSGKAFAGPMPWDHTDRFCLGPDGCGWLFIDKTLSRVHPDGTLEKVKEMKHGARMLFLGDDLYFYNGGRQFFGGFSQVWRIRNVFE